IVDGPREAGSWCVKGGEGALRIANETMNLVLANLIKLNVIPGDRSRIVDCHGVGLISPWCVKAGDGALRIANETMRIARGIDGRTAVIRPGNRSRFVDAGWLGFDRPWWVKGRNAYIYI